MTGVMNEREEKLRSRRKKEEGAEVVKGSDQTGKRRKLLLW